MEGQCKGLSDLFKLECNKLPKRLVKPGASISPVLVTAIDMAFVTSRLRTAYVSYHPEWQGMPQKCVQSCAIALSINTTFKRMKRKKGTDFDLVMTYLLSLKF